MRRRRAFLTSPVEILEGRALLSAATPDTPSLPAQVAPLPGQRPTITTLHASTQSNAAGETVTLIATVNAVPHGRIVTSGRVRFSIISPTQEVLGFAHLNARGGATLKTRRLQSGETYEIQAEFLPSQSIVGRSSGTVSVTPAPAMATKFRISAPQFFGAPGSPVTFSVTALDRAGQTVTGYTGTIELESPTDHSAKLAMKKYTFTPLDGGTHEFADGVTFRKGGAEVLKVFQVSNTRISGNATFGIE